MLSLGALCDGVVGECKTFCPPHPPSPLFISNETSLGETSSRCCMPVISSLPSRETNQHHSHKTPYAKIKQKLRALQRLAICLAVVGTPLARQGQSFVPALPLGLFRIFHSHAHDQDQHVHGHILRHKSSGLGAGLVLAAVDQDTSTTIIPIATSTMQPPPRPSATFQEEDVFIPSSDDVQIASKISNKHSPIAVVISHPYGPLGGNMMNNVVWAMTQHLSRFGFTTLRFNFRGVAPSTGRTSWTGAGEKEDMRAVCEYALTQLESPPQKLLIIGYSHGSVVGSALGGEMPQVHAYAAIAYPFSVAFALTLFRQGGYFTSAAKGEKPKLFVMGSQDQFTGIGTFIRKVKLLPSPTEVVTMEGVDHFFFGKEKALCEVVQAWLEKVMGAHDLKGFLTYAAAAAPAPPAAVAGAAAVASAGEGSDDGGKGRDYLEKLLPEVCEDGHQEL